ncbi:White-brown-complex ABC transporter family [Hibiscus syriacus]|uniref:White-brown-complex ABC transporter family n=1 Tax=Hibiscus syriacus TaxID=106335 RepID=A0A6A2Y9M5_HIBSY|nr:White-brown-complex ABC transporter family [Hibiscus syriacus]
MMRWRAVTGAFFQEGKACLAALTASLNSSFCIGTLEIHSLISFLLLAFFNVKDIMYQLYRATKSRFKSIAPKEIKLLKHLLNITDPEERFSALATAFSPGNEHEAKGPHALYTTTKELHKWIKIMLDAYMLNKEETDIKEAKKMSQHVVIQKLFILKETIEQEYLDQRTPTPQMDSEME